MISPRIGFADPEIQECPFSSYDVLRREAPVYFDGATQMYVVTRYDDVRAIMLDPTRFSSITGLVQTRGRKEVVELYEKKGWVPVPTLLNNDPPSHRFYRSWVDKAFGPARTAMLNDYIVRNVGALIDDFINLEGEVEFVKEFALRLPLFARTEVRVALAQLLDRIQNIRYARKDRAHSWVHRISFVTWGPQKLFIQFDRR